jgi:hypothetical protein
VAVNVSGQCLTFSHLGEKAFINELVTTAEPATLSQAAAWFRQFIDAAPERNPDGRLTQKERAIRRVLR